MRSPSVMLWRRFFWLMTGLVTGMGLFAPSAKAAAGTESAAFLNIPVGAGPAAMGGAYTALATDAYAATWNPSGLGRVSNTQIAGQHLSYLESIHYEYLSFAHPVGTGGAVGGSVQYLGSGDIAGTDRHGNPTGDFSNSYAAYSLAYGRRLGERFSLGLTGKWIHAKLADVSADAFAGDAGAHFRVNDKLSLAAVVANVGSQLKFLQDGGDLPMAFRLSSAWTPIKPLTLAAEGVFPKAGDPSAHVGLAWRPIPMISLRTGFRTDTLKENDTLAGFSTGLGLDLWGQEFAYAWVPYGDLGNTQYFSLLVRFGAEEQRRRNLIHYQSIKKHQLANGSSMDDVTTPDYQQLMQLLNDTDRDYLTQREMSELAQ